MSSHLCQWDNNTHRAQVSSRERYFYFLTSRDDLLISFPDFSAFRSLKRLIVQGNPTMEDRELVCLLLEDYLPKVYIEGVDYLGNLPEDAKQRILALDAPEPPKLLTEPKVEEEANALRVASK